MCLEIMICPIGTEFQRQLQFYFIEKSYNFAFGSNNTWKPQSEETSHLDSKANNEVIGNKKYLNVSKIECLS